MDCVLEFSHTLKHLNANENQIYHRKDGPGSVSRFRRILALFFDAEVKQDHVTKARTACEGLT